jgi:hypothetical protein
MKTRAIAALTVALVVLALSFCVATPFPSSQVEAHSRHLRVPHRCALHRGAVAAERAT